MIEIKNKLKMILESTGMTQADLATVIEVTQPSIYNKVTGRSELTEKQRRAIENYFNLTPAVWYDDEYFLHTFGNSHEAVPPKAGRR